MDFPNKKYSIIYADPPWEMQGGVYKPKYSTMSVKEVCSLPVDSISNENCALFLWVLNSRLQEGLDVIKSWGFTYKTIAFCWVKTSQQTGMPNCRVGTFTLGGMEICLLGLKGTLKRETLNIRQVLLQPRGKHSEKPEKIRNDITLLYGELSRIELFARKKYEGWDVWGDEVS